MSKGKLVAALAMNMQEKVELYLSRHSLALYGIGSQIRETAALRSGKDLS
jgi:hypothetical protein